MNYVDERFFAAASPSVVNRGSGCLACIRAEVLAINQPRRHSAASFESIGNGISSMALPAARAATPRLKADLGTGKNAL
jgi:hypothetical protein